MIKLNVMGKMKWMSQMIQDGSFDESFVPAYKKALESKKQVFAFGGLKYSTGYGRIIVNYVNGFRDKINDLKNIEK
tara:strand:+ start:3228 stop:3455 length:228 start_codon:yes stop_codon:yes gene_type:complete